jgi:hypothetical protein
MPRGRWKNAHYRLYLTLSDGSEHTAEVSVGAAATLLDGTRTQPGNAHNPAGWTREWMLRACSPHQVASHAEFLEMRYDPR